MPTTSQVAILSMQTAFTNLLEQGYDVLGIFLSAKLSGTIQSAIQARSALGKGQSIFTSVSPVVGAHTWPGTLGLAYMTGL